MTQKFLVLDRLDVGQNLVDRELFRGLANELVLLGEIFRREDFRQSGALPSRKDPPEILDLGSAVVAIAEKPFFYVPAVSTIYAFACRRRKYRWCFDLGNFRFSLSFRSGRKMVLTSVGFGQRTRPDVSRKRRRKRNN